MYPDVWQSRGIIIGRSRDTPGTYEGLSYTVRVDVPDGPPVVVTDVVPEPGQRDEIDDAEVDVRPCALGKKVDVVSLGNRWLFYFNEGPHYGVCEASP